MDADDQLDDEGSSAPLLPLADRLWRHPSELTKELVPAGRRAGSETTAPALRATVADGTCSPDRPERHPGEPRAATIALLSGVVGALLATGALYTLGGTGTRSVVVPALERDVAFSPVATLAATRARSAFLVAAARVQTSCVVITAHQAHGTAVSEGVVFRSDGMAVAVAHMVTGAQSLTATVGGDRRVTARVVASDAASDLAVLKLDGSGYSPAPLGSALALRVGDPVISVRPTNPGPKPGDAAGDDASVSALGQNVALGGGSGISDLVEVQMTQPSPTLGRPLLDGHGAVVAITTMHGAPGKAVDYALPVDLARRIATQLLASGRVVPVWLGVSGHDLPAATAASLGVSGGAVVDQVTPSGPAAAGGVKAGDIVVGMDGHDVTSMANLVMSVHAQPPGTPIELDVAAGDGQRTVIAVVTVRPAGTG